MSAFWSAYITILSLGCLAFVAGAMYFTTHLDVHRDSDGTTGHEYDGIQEYDNPMPRWWVKMYWMGVASSSVMLLYIPPQARIKAIQAGHLMVNMTKIKPNMTQNTAQFLLRMHKSPLKNWPKMLPP